MKFESKELFGQQFVYREGCPEGSRYSDQYEVDTIDRFRKHVARGGAFLDVGGNYGFYSVLARSCNTRLPIYYFDPNPLNYTCFTETMRRNGWEGVSAYCVAIGDGFRMAQYQMPDWYTNAQLGVKETGQPVLITSLDATPASQSRVGAVKIDVEGMELEVLKGASMVLDYRPVLFIEFCPELLALHGAMAQDMLKLIINLGYSVEHLYISVPSPGTVFTDPDECMRDFVRHKTWISNLCCVPL